MKIEYLSLEDVCERIVDCPHESPEWRDQGIHVIRNFNLIDGQIDLSDSYYVDEETYRKRIQRAVPQAGDIIFSREAPIGNCAIIPDGFKCCLGQRLVLLRVNKAICSSEYLLAALRSDYVKCQIDQVSRSGSIVSNFNIGDLKKLVIPVVENMESIAKTSALLNAKLSLNKHLCSELESMAKTLYDYWFVQFDFPDANGKPYRASGGEMVWNEQLKREIPKEWSAKKLNQLADYGQAKAVSIDSDHYVGMDNMLPNMGGIVTSKYSPTETGNVAFECGDILLGNIRPYFKKLWLSDFDGGCSPDVLAIHPKNKKISTFIYCTLGRDTFFDYDVKGCKGTKMPRGDKGHIMNYLFSFDESIALRFSQLADALFRKIQMTRRESIELAKLRDWLLPMLMNGQATVAPAEAAPKLQVLQPEKPVCDPRFDRWLQTQGVAARGTVDEQTLHDIFDAMDDDDKQ